MISWEIAPFIAIIFIIPLSLTIYYLKSIKSGKTRRPLILKDLVIIFIIIFQIWAFIPCLTAPFTAEKFTDIYENVFGKNYLSFIPKEVKQRLADKPFDVLKLLFMQSAKKSYAERKTIYYGNSSNQYLDIYLPMKPIFTPYPALVVIHGGATVKRNITNRGIATMETVNYFTAQGMAVITIEYRKPPEATFVEMIKDIRTAIVWIHEHSNSYSINKSQIFVLGRSRGGQLATTAIYSGVANNSWYLEHAGNYSSEYFAVAGIISVYGTLNPYLTKKLGNYYLFERNKVIYGSLPETEPNIYNLSSASFLVTKESPPTLLIHGRLDNAVFPEESRDLKRRLSEYDILNIYLEFPTGKHGFDTFSWSANGQLMHYFVERFIWAILYVNKYST